MLSVTNCVTRLCFFFSFSFQGRVNLKKPDHKFFVMETDDYGSNNGLPPVVKRTIFFGREVGAADRHLLPMYQLKSRKYIGPTAMDAEMAFLMANQGLARPGKLVYDPFVGTGSILVAAAHFGAMTMVCTCADTCAFDFLFMSLCLADKVFSGCRYRYKGCAGWSWPRLQCLEQL